MCSAGEPRPELPRRARGTASPGAGAQQPRGTASPGGRDRLGFHRPCGGRGWRRWSRRNIADFGTAPLGSGLGQHPHIPARGAVPSLPCRQQGSLELFYWDCRARPVPPLPWAATPSTIPACSKPWTLPGTGYPQLLCGQPMPGSHRPPSEKIPHKPNPSVSPSPLFHPDTTPRPLRAGTAGRAARAANPGGAAAALPMPVPIPIPDADPSPRSLSLIPIPLPDPFPRSRSLSPMPILIPLPDPFPRPRSLSPLPLSAGRVRRMRGAAGGRCLTGWREPRPDHGRGVLPRGARAGHGGEFPLAGRYPDVAGEAAGARRERAAAPGRAAGAGRGQRRVHPGGNGEGTRDTGLSLWGGHTGHGTRHCRCGEGTRDLGHGTVAVGSARRHHLALTSCRSSQARPPSPHGHCSDALLYFT